MNDYGTMGMDAVALAVCWIITTIVLLTILARAERAISRERDQMFEERIAWRDERQQLLDRIQAGNFVEYKQAEVRLEKAKHGEPEPPRLERL